MKLDIGSKLPTRLGGGCLFSAALIAGAALAQNVAAGGDCSGAAVGSAIVGRIGGTDVSWPVVEGETITYFLQLSNGLPTACDFVEGQLSCTFPNATVPPSPPPGQYVMVAGFGGTTPDVPQVSFGVPFEINAPIGYIVNADDATNIGGSLVLEARLDYGMTVVRPDQVNGTFLSDPPLQTASATNSVPLFLAVPEINIEKSADVDGLCVGVDTEVMYTYVVTIPGNPGNQPLENVVVTDDLCGPVTFVDGDANGDGILDLDETWIYTCMSVINDTTTNVAVASGEFNTPSANVTVTDEDDLTIVASPPPDLMIKNPNVDVCAGEEAQFVANLSGGTAPYTVQWFAPDGSLIGTCMDVPSGGTCASPPLNESGEYCAVVVDANGCEAEACGVLVVNPARVISIVDPGNICDGQEAKFCASISGGTAPYTVEWFGPDGQSLGVCEGVPEGGECCSPFVGTPGEYCVVATDSAGCFGEDCITLNIDSNVTVIVEPIEDAVCEGDSQMFCATVSDGAAPYTVEWRDPAGNVIEICNDVREDGQCCIMVSEPGVYCAYVVDANGCDGEACGTLIVNENPEVVVDPPLAVICDGETAELCAVATGGTPPYDYMWSTGETSECIIVGIGDEYCVTITDANGCVAEGCGTMTVNPNPECTIVGPPMVCVGEENQYCGPAGMASYAWSIGGDGMIVGAADQQCVIAVGTMVGGYTLTLEIVDVNGCSSTCTLDVMNEECGGGQGCTPGYWKQPHHFIDWSAPYQPDDMFSMYFEDAFAGKSLLTVLSQPASADPGPNSLNSLGRHTVAALLNAANDEVSYGMSPQGVIDAFNAVYPGTDEEYTALKNEFAASNEAGCPLNGQSDANGDGLVDAGDLVEVIGNWGGTGIGDVNDDGIVDVADLRHVLTWWGT
ncbi:MAG: hypothetical protein ACYTGR_03425 [Planctomycetota bacterium]|jgi:hypothetical protein